MFVCWGRLLVLLIELESELRWISTFPCPAFLPAFRICSHEFPADSCCPGPAIVFALACLYVGRWLKQTFWCSSETPTPPWPGEQVLGPELFGFLLSLVVRDPDVHLIISWLLRPFPGWIWMPMRLDPDHNIARVMLLLRTTFPSFVSVHCATWAMWPSSWQMQQQPRSTPFVHAACNVLAEAFTEAAAEFAEAMPEGFTEVKLRGRLCGSEGFQEFLTPLTWFSKIN